MTDDKIDARHARRQEQRRARTTAHAEDTVDGAEPLGNVGVAEFPLDTTPGPPPPPADGEEIHHSTANRSEAVVTSGRQFTSRNFEGTEKVRKGSASLPAPAAGVRFSRHEDGRGGFEAQPSQQLVLSADISKK